MLPTHAWPNNIRNALAITLITLCGLYVFRWVVDPEMTFFADDWTWLDRAIFDDWNSFVSIWTILPARLFVDRPIQAISIKLLYQVFDLHYWGYGAVILSVHIANGILLYFLAMRLLSSWFYGMIVAILFVINLNIAYPAWWVATVADSACLFFCLCAFLSFLSKNSYSAVLTVFFYYIAVKSKEAALPFPLILFVQSFLEQYTSLGLSDVCKSLLYAIRRTWPVLLAFLVLFSFSMYYFAIARIKLDDFGPYAPKFDISTVMDGLGIYLSHIACNLISPDKALIGFAVLTVIAIVSSTRNAVLGALAFVIAAAPVLVLATQRMRYYAYIPSPYADLFLIALVQRAEDWIARRVALFAGYVIGGAALIATLWFTYYIYARSPVTGEYAAIDAYRRAMLAFMRENSKALKTLQAAVSHVEDKSTIVITGLPPNLGLFDSHCASIKAVFKVREAYCRTEGTTPELVATYKELPDPKILLNYHAGDVSLVARSP